jgi:hypothetical protein
MLVTDSPQTLAYRTTMALAELVRGNYQLSESLYEGVNIDWSKVNMGWTAVRAAVLGANGKDDDAKKLAGLVDTTHLREGEKKLLEKFVYKSVGREGIAGKAPKEP